MRYTARSANTQPIRRIHQNLNEMKILIVASDKGNKFAPFIEEQITALQQEGVQIIRYGVTGKGITGYLSELPALRRLIRAERPDIVHAHFGLSGLLANLQRLVPVVTTYHGSDINVPKILRFSRFAMRLSAFNIFVSRRNIAIAIRRKGEEAKRLSGKYALLPCGVNLTDDQLASRSEARKALGIAEDAKIILFAGAFNNAVKDPELAKAVVEYLQTQCNGTEAPVYSVKCKGEETSGTVTSADTQQQGCDTQHVQHANTPYTRQEFLELRGYSRSQVNQLMCAADALLMTSRTEGSPQVIKEAMACRCPIVSVDVGDVAERVSGVEGCYVVPSREPKDIAAALLQAITFEGRTNGRDRIIEMQLSNEQVAKQLLRIYEQVLV